MAAQQRQSNRSQGRGSSQSSSFPERLSSPWVGYNRDPESSPFHGSSQLSGNGSLSTVDTQEVRNGVIDLVNRASAHARQGGSNYSGYPDPDDLERPSKRRKISPTQPGRGIRKVVDLYHELTDLLNKARRQTTIDELRDDPERDQVIEEMDQIDFPGMTEEEIEDERKEYALSICKRCLRAVKLLEKLIPNFRQKADAAENTSSYCAPLQTGANDARSDDTSRLKVAVAEWLNSRSPSIRLSAKGKGERGINHDLTGLLLCPIDYNWNDPDVRTKLRNAEEGYNFASSFFLRCLYEKESGDPNFPDIGFLKGPLLVRAYRHIFTAPSSASSENASESTTRRRDVASNLRLDGHVTPRSIAYTATQLVFSLNSAREWKKEHAGFHYPSFYKFIVDFFEDTEDSDGHSTTAMTTDLLRWWSGQVFPATALRTGTQDSRDALRDSKRRLKECRDRQIHS